MNELENCPFCGTSNPVIWEHDDGWLIQCVEGCVVTLKGYETREGVVRAWNRRPRPEDKADDPQVAYIAEIEAEVEQLQAALIGMVAHKPAYIGVFSTDGARFCRYCHRTGDDIHRDDCPVTVARKLLDSA